MDSHKTLKKTKTKKNTSLRPQFQCKNHVRSLSFCVKKRVLLVDFLSIGETVNAKRFCEKQRKLYCAIQKNSQEILFHRVDLLYFACYTQDLIS